MDTSPHRAKSERVTHVAPAFGAGSGSKWLAFARAWLAFAVLATILVAGVAPAQAQYITMALPSFNATNTSGFIFDGVHAPSYIPALPAFSAYIPSGTSVIRLTDASTWLAGTVVSKQRIDLPADRSFSSFFSFSIPNHGADGLVFVLQGVTSTPKTLGGGMGFLGKPGSQPNSLAIEFDTWYNGATDAGVTVNDPNNNHVGVDLNGSMQSAITTSPPGGADMAGKPWNVWVDYDGSAKVLKVRMSQTATRPAAPTLSYPIDLTTVIGQNVYTGFTAGTGAAVEQHDLTSLYFESSYLAGGITPATTHYSSAPDVALPSSGATQTVAAGSTTTLTATFQDSLGNAVPQLPATFTADAGAISQLAPTTDASGQIAASYTAPSTPGTYTVIASGEGGVSTSFIELVADITAPSTAAFGVPTGWSPAPVTLTLAAADNVGVASTYYAINGGLPQLYVLPVSISAEGTTTVSYWSLDAVGNREVVKSATVRVDSTAPTASVSGIPGGITTTPVTFSLAGADALSGVSAMDYRLDGGAEDLYTGPVTVSKSGFSTVSYRVVDAAGNSSAEATAEFTIHAEAPVSSVSGIPDASSSQPVTVTIDAQPSDGVLVWVEWSLDGSPVATAPVPFSRSIGTEGTHTLSYRAMDAAGLAEATHTATFDIVAPAYPATPTPPPTTPTTPTPPPVVPPDPGVSHSHGMINGDVLSEARLSLNLTGTDLHYGSPAQGDVDVPEVNFTRTVVTNTGDVLSGLFIQGDGPARLRDKDGSWAMNSTPGKDAFAWKFTSNELGMVDITSAAATPLGTLGYNDSQDFASAIDMPTFTTRTGTYQWSATIWVTAPE